MPRAKKQEEAPSKAERLAQLVAGVNTRMKGNVLSLAKDASTSYLLRRPTGITSLDIGIGGGFPAAALSVVTGPDGVGKDYIINRTIAELQRNYGEDTRVAVYNTELKYDKGYARQAGVKVACNDDELDEINVARKENGLPALTKQERAEYKTQVGEIVLIEAPIAEEGLDAVIDCVLSNVFQLVVINSFGVMQTAAKEDQDSFKDFAQQSNEAILMSKFIPKLLTILNRDDIAGERNETAILGTVQVRARRDQVRMRPGVPVPDYLKYQAGSGSWALKHGKAIDLTLHKGTPIIDKEQKPPVVLGRETKWEITKGKLGTHDGIKGTYDFYFGSGVDLASDLLTTGLQLGILAQAGAWVTWEHETYGFKAMGLKKAADELMAKDGAYDALRRECLKTSDVSFRYR